MKKLLSLSIALAMLVTFMVPAVVAADWTSDDADELGIEDPGAYAKTPFGIFGTGIQLVGYLLGDFEAILGPEGMDMELPFALGDLQIPVLRSGAWVAGPVAWMTDMTAWFMILAGDVIEAAADILVGLDVDLGFDLVLVKDVFYTVAERMFDPWDYHNPNAPEGVYGNTFG